MGLGQARVGLGTTAIAPPPGRTAEQVFKDMGSFEGKTFKEIKAILEQNGFSYRKPTPGGYEKFYGPGPKAVRNEVWIRPNGQVIRVEHVRGGPPVRYDSTGNVTTDHQSGELIGGR